MQKQTDTARVASTSSSPMFMVQDQVTKQYLIPGRLADWGDYEHGQKFPSIASVRQRLSDFTHIPQEWIVREFMVVIQVQECGAQSTMALNVKPGKFPVSPIV